MAGSRVFVAGATGYTGRSVVAVARSAGHRVVAHLRPDSPRRAQLEPVFGELGAEISAVPWSPEAIRVEVARVQPTHVFALLGTTAAKAREAARAGERADYAAVDVGMTCMLIDAVEAHAPAARFVYLSSAGAGGAARNVYLAARAEVEERLRASSLPWTIARPSFITGPDRDEHRPVEHLGARALDGVARLLGAVGAAGAIDGIRSINGERLARALWTAAEAPAYEGRIVEAAELQSLAP